MIDWVAVVSDVLGRQVALVIDIAVRDLVRKYYFIRYGPYWYNLRYKPPLRWTD